MTDEKEDLEDDDPYCCGKFKFNGKTKLCVLDPSHDGPHKVWQLVAYHTKPLPPIVIVPANDDYIEDDE